MFGPWRFDALAVASATLAIAAYTAGLVRLHHLGRPRWPRTRTLWFACGIAMGLSAIESPLEAAGERAFTPHMVQHLILTSIAAPLVLCGAPLLLFLSTVPTRVARRAVAWLRGPVGHALAFPPLAWSSFIATLWLTHMTGFFEAALERESVHVLEHALYFGAALLFWFPIVTIGPTPWSTRAFAYPLRMAYLLLAMPAQVALGFAIYTDRHVLYATYVARGLEDQRNAGELMWVGGSLLAMVPLLLVGAAWARSEERAAERADVLAAIRQSSS